jgi:alcohol dehydrogenase class IV
MASRDDLVRLVEGEREAQTDLIATLGDGSVTDGTKAVQLCFTNDIRRTIAFE